MANKRDEKPRNAYKRFWRNMRNYQHTVDQMEKLDAQAERQLNNALDAYNRMEVPA